MSIGLIGYLAVDRRASWGCSWKFDDADTCGLSVGWGLMSRDWMCEDLALLTCFLVCFLAILICVYWYAVIW